MGTDFTIYNKKKGEKKRQERKRVTQNFSFQMKGMNVKK